MEDLEVLRLLGQGGYASVYLCRRKGSDELHALKRIPRAKLATHKQQERVATERVLLESARSPFLCRSLASFETAEEVAFLLQYVDGRMLYECVWKYRDTGRFPEAVAKFFAAQVVLAVREIHARGYIHRDLKSGNILVGPRGFAKVIDFGLSKRVVAQASDKSTSERTHSVCGTHYVMAPEIYFRESCGFAVDWWSLGVVVYEMVVGRPPWEYRCPPGSSNDDFFRRIKRTAAAPFESASGHEQASIAVLSPEMGEEADIESCCGDGGTSQLLKVNPHERLGHNGATEVMRHPWFHDVDWELLESRQDKIVSPYDPQTDFNPALVHTMPTQDAVGESMSSAESIDPEDDAKFFGDF